MSYYTTSRPMTIAQFIELEVNERNNYDLDDVKSWIEQYNITESDQLLWVTTKPHIAARYSMDAEDWENAEEIYNQNPEAFNVSVINDEGVLVSESDDGDDGFIFLLSKK